jgi:hypothetical protein
MIPTQIKTVSLNHQGTQDITIPNINPLKVSLP